MGSASATPSRREHVQALLLAALCAVLFLREALLPGRALVPFPPEQFDVLMAEARANGTFDPVDACRGNAGMGDKYLQSLCWDRVLQDRLARGELPRWTRDIGGGAPFVPQMAQPYEPVNLLLLLLPSVEWYGWWFLLHQVLFGWFAYTFLRRLGCRHLSALVGLVAAALGLWTQGKLHHNVILTAAVAVWPMLSAAHDLVAGGRRGRAALGNVGWLALWTGVSWNSGFVVVSLQASYLTVLFALFLALRAPRGERRHGLLAVAAGLGLGAVLALPNMLPVLAASAVSARAGTFDAARLAAHGLEWDHLLSLCWPDLLSWAGDHFYAAPTGPDALAYEARLPWSQLVLLANPLSPVNGSGFQSWVETSFAIGLPPLALACLAFAARERRALAWFFAAVALAAFGTATADQPFLSVARLVPGLTDADQRRALFSVAIALCVLAGLGAEALLAGARRWPALVLLGAAVLLSLLALGWLGQNAGEPEFVRAYAGLWLADADHPDVVRTGHDLDAVVRGVMAAAAPGEALQNHARLAATAWRTLLVGVLLLVVFAWRRRSAVPVAIALAIAELLHVGRGPVQTVPAARVTTPPAVLAPVLAAPAPGGVRPRLQRLVVQDQARVQAALPGNLPAVWGIEDAGAYNPLPPARFEDFFRTIEPDRAGKTSVAYGGAGVGSFHDPASLAHPLCDLYGIRFVLTRDAVPLRSGLVERTPPGTGGFRLLERTTTLPRATFVRTVDVLPDRTDRLQALARADRDVAQRVVLEDPAAPRPTAGPAAPADVQVVAHADERVVVRVRCEADGYLRLADPYDAGWRATVDGQPSAVYAADHWLRAVFVPPGDHEVVFTYDAARVVWPARLGLLALCACVALLLLGQRRQP
ncbi:MAG: YfhO family protein [Planctomycetes bacterium]|nr:YfhO family protein [Planctomycetota bacterium]